MTLMSHDVPPDSPSTLSPSDWRRSNGRIVWRRLLQRKLLLKITIPAVIGLVQLVLAVLAIVAGSARPVVMLWTVPALLVGYLFGRSTKIAWNSEATQIAIIQAQAWLAVGYIVVRVGSHFLMKETLSGRVNDVATTLLLVSFGLFLGRSIGLSDQIWHALVSHNSEDPGGAPRDS